MPELYVSWVEYHRSIELLAAKIHQSDYQFDQIICIARGGLRVGDILSRIFHQPLAILATSSYRDETHERGKIAIASQMTMTTARLGSQVLLVDDLVDSGITLQQTIVWLRERYPEIEQIRTAVIWHKARSICVPDYSVSYLADDPWIHQPFEKYDRIYRYTKISRS
jgi:hypoxanthine phosphoribosyltransferase